MNCTIDQVFDENKLYYQHLKGECICLKCKCGQCRCPFSKKLAPTHLKARSLYQREYTPKKRAQSMSFNADSFPYSSVKQPLEAFRMKVNYRPSVKSESLKPLILEKPKLEQFVDRSTYVRQFKELPIDPQEAIRPINSLFLVKNIPNLYRSNYKNEFKRFQPSGHLWDGPDKPRKGLIGCDVSFYSKSKYSEEFQKLQNQFPQERYHKSNAYLQTSSFKGQFDTSSKRSFKPYLSSLCPAKLEVSQHEIDYQNEKYKLHL